MNKKMNPIKLARLLSGKTLNDVSKESGVSYTILSSIENFSTPKHYTPSLGKILNYWGLSFEKYVEMFYTISDEMNKSFYKKME